MWLCCDPVVGKHSGTPGPVGELCAQTGVFVEIFGTWRNVSSSPSSSAVFVPLQMSNPLSYCVFSYLCPSHLKVKRNCEISLMSIWTFSIVTDYTNTTFRKQTAFVFR
jgi:hypothetical protein